MKPVIILSVFCSILYKGYSQTESSVSAERISEVISHLSSDELKGRRCGSPEDSVSACYIRQCLKKADAAPLFGDYFQRYEVITDVYPGKNNSLSAGGLKALIDKDFIPATFSASESFGGDAVFSGYGFDIKKDTASWNDYLGVETMGKWVMLLAGKPEFPGSEIFDRHLRSRSKTLTAKDKGAKGVIIVINKKDDFSAYRVFDNSISGAGIPVFFITEEFADKILAKEKTSVAELKEFYSGQKKNQSFPLQVPVNGSADLIRKKSVSYNIAAVIEGSDEKLKNEYIVIGAHHDHLGMGGPESGSRTPDTIAVHNGADDNASGVAGVLELAELFSRETKNLKRSLIFVAFGGEEVGMLGSKEFVKNPPVSLKSVNAMFNFDMIGRMKADKPKLSVGGTGTSAEADSLIELISGKYSFTISKSPDGYGPSDHASFYKNNIPVFFITTGVHDDYHSPFDDFEKLDINQTVNAVDFSYNLIKSVANSEKPLTFKESGSKEENATPAYKVTLGIIPDYIGSSDKGMSVDGVKKGGPAEAGGMKKGDIITSVDDMPVTNIYDYMARLNTLKKGQTIKVGILRDGAQGVLTIKL